MEATQKIEAAAVVSVEILNGTAPAEEVVVTRMKRIRRARKSATVENESMMIKDLLEKLIKGGCENFRFKFVSEPALKKGV